MIKIASYDYQIFYKIEGLSVSMQRERAKYSLAWDGEACESNPNFSLLGQQATALFLPDGVKARLIVCEKSTAESDLANLPNLTTSDDVQNDRAKTPVCILSTMTDLQKTLKVSK